MPSAGGRGALPGRTRKSAGGDHLSWESIWDFRAEALIEEHLRRRGSSLRESNTDIELLDASSPARDAEAEGRRRHAAADALAEACSDPCVHTRAVAIVALARTDHPDADSAISAALRDETGGIREAAVLALGLRGRPGAVPLLIEMLRDSPVARAASGGHAIDSRRQAFAAVALGLLGLRDFGSVRGAIHELQRVASGSGATADTRTAAAFALGLAGAPEVVPGLLEILRDPSAADGLRAQAAASLGRLSDVRAVPDLLSILSGPSAGLSRAAIVSLAVAPDTGGRVVATELLSRARSHPDRATRALALLSLADRGDPALSNALISIFESGSGDARTFGALAVGLAGWVDRNLAARAGPVLQREFLATRNADERSAMALALGLCGQSDAAPALRSALSHAGSARLAGHAAVALGFLGDAGAVPAVRLLLRDGRDPLRMRRALEALALLDGPDAIEAASDVLADRRTSPALRTSAALLMGHMREERALAAALRVFESHRLGHCEPARTSAALALGIIGDRDVRPLRLALRDHVDPTRPAGVVAEVLGVY